MENLVNTQGYIISNHLTKLFDCSSTVKLAHIEHNPIKEGPTSGPPLMILHGLFGSKNNWQLLSKKIADRLNKQVRSYVRL